METLILISSFSQEIYEHTEEAQKTKHVQIGHSYLILKLALHESMQSTAFLILA